jgi:DNA repair exonuclease SbcCD ATPase subunit
MCSCKIECQEMASSKVKAPGPVLAAGAGQSSIENQLREEIKQLTAALDETDQALDEWVAECERLQKVIKAKEGESKTLGLQMEELKQHALRLEDERNQLKANTGKKAQLPTTTAGASSDREVDELRRANEALREQLAQSQRWVKEGLAKLDQANATIEAHRKKNESIESEKNALMQGQKSTIEQERDKAAFDAARLGNVVHAHELEIASLKAKLAQALEDKRDAEALAGKSQALCTVAKFQAECSNTDNDTLVHWMKQAVRWSSRL